MANFCSRCGKKLKEDEKFCTKCGNNINGILNTSVITPAKKSSNKQGEMSIVGFILSLIGILSCGFTSIFGLIFSIIGLVKDKKKGQKYDLAIVGIIFSVCSIMIWVVLFMFIILAKDVEVIDFSDMTYEEAVKYCETSELNCFPARTYSDTVPEGGFIRQSVEPGEKLKSIFSVGVWYSKGKEVKNEEKKAEEKKEIKKDTKDYKSTFSLDSESGIAYVEGYASKEHVQGGGMYSSEDEEEEYVFFNILNTDSDDFMEYIEDSKGNSYVGDKAIGIGCISGSIIKYYNSSDEESVDTEYNEYKLDKETTNKILKSSKDYPITLKLERKEFTGGGAAPLCYSHITHVSVVE